jgi:hypothetical protein
LCANFPQLILRSLIKLRVPRVCCQPSEITGFPPDFNSAGSSIQNRLTLGWRTFCSAPEALLPLAHANPAHAKAEELKKIKDRLEALLFAETLQGTLSPNANPGKGSIRGFTEFDAASRREDSADSLDTSSLVLDWFVIPK